MLITKDMICIDADLKDKEKIIRAVAERMDRAGKLADQEGYIREVFKREGEISTNLGDGIAMPHARTAHVKEAGLVFLRLKDEVQWEEGSAPVRRSFCVFNRPAVPARPFFSAPRGPRRRRRRRAEPPRQRG